MGYILLTIRRSWELLGRKEGILYLVDRDRAAVLCSLSYSRGLDRTNLGRQRVRGAAACGILLARGYTVTEEEGGSGKFGTKLWATGHDVLQTSVRECGPKSRCIRKL